MSSSVNPISAAQLMDECSPANKQYTKVLWHKNKTLLVRRFIPLEEMLDLVKSAVEIISPPGMDIVLPELMDFAVKIAVVGYYASVQLPDSLYAQYELIYTTDLYETICKAVSQSQLKSITDTLSLIVSTSLYKK